MKRCCLLALAMLLTAPAAADVIDVRQGTNISVAIDPAGQMLLVDLLGGLWRLPVSGGGATMLMSPGSGIAQPRFDAGGTRTVVERQLDGRWDLWMLDLSSGAWEQITDTPYAERQPDFIDGDRGLVFVSNRSGREQLWTLDLRTHALRQLTDEPGVNRFPAVGPDGNVAYVNEYGGRYSLRVLTLGPSGQTIHASDNVIAAPSWRPDSAGPVLVYNVRDTANSDLALLIDADIRINRRLTRNEDVFVGRVAWLAPGEFVYGADGQLWRREVASTERRPVHMFAGISVDPVAAPRHVTQLDERGPHPVAGIRDLSQSRDGKTLVFAALGDIWLARGRELEQLTDDPAVDVEPVMLADGGTVLFLSDRDGSFDLWRVDTKTRGLALVSSRPGDAANLFVTADGGSAYFVSTARNNSFVSSTIFRTAVDGGRTETVAGPFDGTVTLTPADGVLQIAGASLPAGVEILLAGTLAADQMASVVEPERTATLDDLRWTAPATEPVVIRAGRLFDGIRNEYRRHVDIHVADGRIVEIVGRGRLPADGRILDFSDATVIPGMIDVHAHHPVNTRQSVGLAWLLRGVTTVREIATDPAAAVERAEAWGSGRRPGPRLAITTIDRELPADIVGTSIGPVAASTLSSGFLHALAGPADLDGYEDFAEAAALPGPGFVLPLSPLKTTYQDTLAVLGGSGGYLSTGLTAALERLSLGDSRRYAARQLTSIVERAQRSFGRIAIGSDAPLVPYGDGFLGEIETLVRAGIPTAQVLRWATAGGAMALGLDGQLGTLEVGKLADLVVVNGDPLARIGDLRDVTIVMKGGNIVFGSVDAVH